MKEPIGHIAATWRRGSALILTVVLTSLLAIVGVLFVMASRIDKMASTAATESRELTCAIDTVLTQIDQALIADVPLVATDQEYYDYPDVLNPWLADLEPYEVYNESAKEMEYYWRQISNVGSVLTSRTRNVPIDGVVGERAAFENPDNKSDPNAPADADGDGVPDAKWFQVSGVMTSKGKPLYAAVRIVDNGGMLNMNTGFHLDQTDAEESRVDGTSQLQVNVLALAAAPGNQPQVQDANTLLAARANNGADAVATVNLDDYERKVIWQYLDVKNASMAQPSPYTPFDVSDELELRYRFLLNQKETDVRIEDCGRFRASTLSTPLEYGGADLDAWFVRAAGGGSESTYAYRHVATTYNMDRIITPKALELTNGARPRKMVNVNSTDEDTLRTTIATALTDAMTEIDPNADSTAIAQQAAQITANLRDYIDDDDEVTVVSTGLSSVCYGFERPCVYISELACRQVRDALGAIRSSYAVELYKPYFEDDDPNSGKWQLVIHNPSSTTDIQVPLQWSGSRRFHVILAEDSQAPLAKDYITFVDPNEPVDTMPLYGYNRDDYDRTPQEVDPLAFHFEPKASIYLRRVVPGADNPITVDTAKVSEGWIQVDGVARSIQRDISPHKCIRRLWAPASQRSTPALGNAGSNYVDVNEPGIIQAHPKNGPLTNIGELGMVFRKSAYGTTTESLAPDVLLNLVDPNNSRLFNYLTVIDPVRWRDPNETRITGRININTAPALVLAQLPWMRYGEVAPFDRAQAIVDYRVRDGVSHPYRSTGDLMQVELMCNLMLDQSHNQHSDTPRGPDLTPDTAFNDLEERDLIFTRISDLVTVRSDVFTAYILVRIGESGPQRRVVAILDRSQVDSRDDKVRLRALQLVPDPR
jgi:DNA uptake protein ComE-like DNA-binding protein